MNFAAVARRERRYHGRESMVPCVGNATRPRETVQIPEITVERSGTGKIDRMIHREVIRHSRPAQLAEKLTLTGW